MNYLNSKTEPFGRIGNEPEFHPSRREIITITFLDEFGRDLFLYSA